MDGVTKRCRKLIASVARPVQPTGRTLSQLAHRKPGTVAAWCPRCKKATEFEYVYGDGHFGQLSGGP